MRSFAQGRARWSMGARRRVQMREVKHLIDGKSVESVNGRTYDRLNPVGGAIATRAAAAGVEDINAAVQAAAAAFPAWAETGPGRRRELLMNAAEALSSRQAEFAEAMIGEVG